MAEDIGANIPPVKVYPDKYEGQIVLVTGGANGIGEVTAKLFASEGATVVIIDIKKENLIEVQKAIQKAGGKADYWVCNVADDREVDHLILGVISKYGKIDILVHLAGIYPWVEIIGHSTEVYRQVMAVNVDSAFFLTRAVLPHMQKAGYGRIINTSSGTLQLPEVGLSAYQTSKAAIIGFTRSTAVEAGPGVTANVILPGLIRTENVWNAHVQPDGSHALLDKLVKKQCVKRHGRPVDIAHTINFIASPEASFITGQIFDCGGGATFH